MTCPDGALEPGEIVSALARLDGLNWPEISIRRFGEPTFAEWCRLSSRQSVVRAAGCCECCESVAQREPRPAVARWVCANGNETLLCGSCLGHWEANAADDPDLRHAISAGRL